MEEAAGRHGPRGSLVGRLGWGRVLPGAFVASLAVTSLAARLELGALDLPGASLYGWAGDATALAGLWLLRSLLPLPRWLRRPLGAFLAITYALLCEVNLLYARFFHGLLPWNAPVGWRDVLHLSGSGWALMRGADLLWLLVALGLAGLSVREDDGALRDRLRSALMATLVFGAAFRVTLSAPPAHGKELSQQNVLVAWAGESLASSSVLGDVLPVEPGWTEPERARRDLITGTVAAWGPDPRFPLFHRRVADPVVADAIRQRAGGKPVNIVLVILESVRGYETFELPGQRPLPTLERLATQSLFAKQAYAASYLSIRGMFASQCSYYPNPETPAIPTVLPEVRVRCLADVLRRRGYQTLWVYGVDQSFQNEGLFARAHGFSEIDDASTFPPGTERIGLGVNDVALFHAAVQRFDHATEPFYGTVTTVSSHHPFVTPRGPHGPFGFTGDYEHYLESLDYLDGALQSFLAEARTRPWFDRTVFLFVADHGIPELPPASERARAGLPDLGRQPPPIFFRIPLMVYAPKLIDPKIIDVPTSQIDILPTVLDLTGTDAEGAFLGHSLFSVGADRSLLMVGFGQKNVVHGDLHCWDLDVPSCEKVTQSGIYAPATPVDAPSLVEWGRRAAALSQYFVRTDRLVPVVPATPRFERPGGGT